MANLRLISIFIESKCLKLLAHQIWWLPIISQELGRGGGAFLPPNQNGTIK